MMTKLLVYFDDSVIIPISCDAYDVSHEMGMITYSKDDYSFVSKIYEFLKSSVGDLDCNTHLIFAESIDYDYRWTIINKFLQIGFKITSYSSQASLKIGEYTNCDQELVNSQLGDNVVLLFSTADSIRVSALVSDGESWHSLGNYYYAKGVGEHPLKRAIVKTVVKKADENKGFFVNEERFQKEVESQYVNANEWLSLYRNPSNVMTIPYTPKIFMGDSVMLNFDKELIRASYESDLAVVLSGINGFFKSNLIDSVKKVIYIGPAFEEKELRDKIEILTRCTNTWPIPYGALGSTFRTFFEEDNPFDRIDDFSSYVAIEHSRNEHIKKWVTSANILRENKELLKKCANSLDALVAKSAIDVNLWLTKAQAELVKSNFEEAVKSLKVNQYPNALLESALSETRIVLIKSNELSYTMQDVKSISGAAVLVYEIEQLIEKLKGLLSKVSELKESIEVKLARIEYCNSHYDEYLELRREFDRTPDYVRKKALIPQIQEISDEELPALKLRQVFAELKYTKERVKAGLFKKKDVVHIHMNVLNDDVLPCEALLNISNEVLVDPSEDGRVCKAFKIAKDQSSFFVDIDSTDAKPLDFSKPIYGYLFTGRHVLDKTAIKCRYIIIK